MKKILIPILILMFFIISCSDSKKTENNADILPDEDEISDEEAVEPDEDTDEPDEDAERNDSEDGDIDDEINPCDPNPCIGIENSTEECIADADQYSCDCDEGYFWDGLKCVDPCAGIDCSQFDHASGTCEPKDAFSFSCDCDEGYFWGYLGCKKIAFPNICTGETKCYNESAKINCPKPGEPFYGQDAQYAKLGYCIKQTFSKKTFSNNPDEIDLNTETTVFDDLFKTEWTYKYIDSGANTWQEAIDYCEDFEYGGHDDWRLPTMKELMLAQYPFSDYDEFWSSDEYAGNDSEAWTAMDGREWTFNSKTQFHRDARCVRGEHIDTTISFDTLGKLNEVVAFDYENGLAWQLYAVHADTFEKALAYCENSNYSGFTDWRLPNLHELASIVNLEKFDLATDLPLHNLTSVNSWTSTNQYYRTSMVNLKTGLIDSDLKSYRADILCVRNEPCKRGHFWNGEKCVQSPCTDELCKNEKHSDGICYLNDFESHACGCVEGYFWDGVNCVSPCDPNQCENDKNSTGECIPLNVDSHNCGCKDGYFWDGEKCVDPCAGISCGDFDHGTGKCKTDSAFNYSCDCIEGYWWWGKDKGCVSRKPGAVNICTGQNKCYDNKKEIPCPAENEEFFGQDANYARLGYCIPQNFSINNSVANEPVVVDNNLGLMWQRNKIPPVEELYIEDVLQYCENLVYGSYDDWRLPSIEDFMTIADFSRYDPAVNTEYFPDNGAFWTSSKSLLIIGYPLFSHEERYTIFDFTKPSAHFEETALGVNKKPHSYKIRCVRGNASTVSEYYFMPGPFGKDTMVSDNNLITIKENDVSLNWNEAMQYCMKLNHAGIYDWKLPNIKEFILSRWQRFAEDRDKVSTRTSTTKFFDPALDFSYYDYSGISSYSPYTKEGSSNGNIFCIANNPCKKGTFWNGEKCVKNPCADNPCKSNTDELNRTCKVIDETEYLCGCNLCFDQESTNGQCYEDMRWGIYCGCEEGYHWMDWDTYYGCYKG